MRGPLAAGVLAATLFTASCAASNEPQPASSTPSPAGHGSYALCLADNGVKTPPVGPGAPPGVDPQVWAKARQACADKAPGPAS